DHSTMRKKIDSIVTAVMEKGNDNGQRILKQMIEVRYCRAIQIDYTFEERSYELWLIGEEGDVYCRTSPIHEYDQKMAKQAADSLGRDDMHSCLERLEIAFRHTPNSSSGLVVLNNCVKKLEEEFRAGNYNRISIMASLAEGMLG